MAAATKIETGRTVATLINVFTVLPERQAELVTVLSRATEETMKDRPGFISANIHASADGERVVNYAQWESEEHFRTMLGDPAAQEHMAQAAALAEGFDPRLFAVESVHHI
ncbi:antibiotic biosynthesis monooxygenase [Streptomyces sp. DSM 41527]|uniref:Antibiotic biosynthesis monooxygenase n=1 Tax=Streptomyces mooreae TaxID=3075523 RepID=A0ABU2T8C7_9ACTN|nr:antibiotic biosynthesis monooxygenase [Streptomyces sp. DSM 41527]MDT0457070.1 antibiotic biosynthesis monooxygenase [Streptomyces sp. DSM 41527]